MQINLFKPINKTKQYIGILKSFNKDEILISIGEKEEIFQRKDISQIKTVYKW